MTGTPLDTQKVLASGAHHGYQLALEIDERSGGAFRFQHGTLYPILHRLESEGLIRGDWEERSSRRRRKSYRLTAAGRRHLKERTAAPEELFINFAGWMISISSMMTVALLTTIFAGLVWFVLSGLVARSEAREIDSLLETSARAT